MNEIRTITWRHIDVPGVIILWESTAPDCITVTSYDWADAARIAWPSTAKNLDESVAEARQAARRHLAIFLEDCPE